MAADTLRKSGIPGGSVTMTNARTAGKSRHQRASRLSRDLLLDHVAARAALRKAHVLARKLRKTATGTPAADLAAEVELHVAAAKKALAPARAFSPRQSKRRI
jgi:hypothetical protein